MRASPQEFLTNVSESGQAEASGGLAEDSKVSVREDKGSTKMDDGGCHDDKK